MKILNFDSFFAAANEVPSGVGLTLYGSAHLIWLGVLLCGVFAISFYYKSLTSRKRKRFKHGLALFIILFELLRQLIYINLGRWGLGLLPLHLCGLTEITILIYAYTSDKTIKESLYALGLPGAISALLFADWLNYPLLHFQSLHSFIQHGALVAFIVMLLVSGELKPDYRRLPAVFGLFGLIGFGLYFFNKVYDTNFFFLNTPSPGSPLVLFEQIAGNPGYIALTILLVLVVWIILYLPFYASSKHRVREAYSLPARK